jgi:tRNA wybutosine-synthesizing protein 2
MKVMFAAGNGTERIRFSKISAPGEIVVDMFAGIGYFTLPLSKHSGLSKLIALEKNQDSAGFLRKNAELNGLSGQVTVYEGDNRVIADEWLGKCDRVLMGFVQEPAKALKLSLTNS